MHYKRGKPKSQRRNPGLSWSKWCKHNGIERPKDVAEPSEWRASPGKRKKTVKLMARWAGSGPIEVAKYKTRRHAMQAGSRLGKSLWCFGRGVPLDYWTEGREDA